MSAIAAAAPVQGALDFIYNRHAAPTAIHLEPWAFVVVQDRDVLKRLSDRAKSIRIRGSTSSTTRAR